MAEYKGHSYSVWDVSVNASGTYFVSASLDRTLRLWNTEYACPLRIFAGHNDGVDVSMGVQEACVCTVRGVVSLPDV